MRNGYDFDRHWAFQLEDIQMESPSPRACDAENGSKYA